MKTIAIALVSLLLFATASTAETVDSDYRGPDAGTLVFSTGTLKLPSQYGFYYRRVGDDRSLTDTAGAGAIYCPCIGFWHPEMSDPDYQGGETGIVQIQHLKPGNYEVYTYGYAGTLVVATIQWSPARPFLLPFTIKPGEATYVGNFARAVSLGTPMADKVGASGYFVISDKHERDIAIARQKVPELPPVTVQVTDVSVFGSPMLNATDPVPHP
ncbi:MAG TPA: hypothetical protein VGF56_06585 [Rhizomicrobium sp.]|jgi:hypothetical protein